MVQEEWGPVVSSDSVIFISASALSKEIFKNTFILLTSMDGWELPCGCCESKSHPLEEQNVL